ncbi:DUF6798 domain-containing protein [Blastopirellula marina]|uniref:DUF6798 domain-containing protein n=1 Tax=Blastopirellula marina TaxID=124 RepID=A0A2S8G1G2_9BACT|nr:DUF6798 domain-containing protein [Blastopirellula marina]PQO38282.1 hypothetical protein C5Y98_09445 [Blastopirellula marina]PTL44938.1 hypothetical protein C5Y97_09450 [Blastopirellula marina]
MNDSTTAEPHDAAESRTAFWRKWIEIAAIVLLFFLYVGPWTPEVNEAHYLAKARHYWNPEWCPDDHFLNSGDAHGVFYWSFGWITTLVSFPVAAWLGRLLCWISIAVAWRRMIVQVTELPWAGLVGMAMGLAGVHYLHMAGEWLIGGVEAKCFAYAFAFWGIGDALSGRWNRAWILLGVASAFHVLVGGWMVVCLMFCWLICPRQRPALVSILPGLLIGGAIALIGVVPLLLLNHGVAAEDSALASYYYVYKRLNHHLVVHMFSWDFKLRFTLAAIAWAGTAWLLRNHEKARLLNGIVAGSVVLVLIGVSIDQYYAFVRDQDYLGAAKLLRFYWYRIADVMVPIGLTINLLVIYQLYKTQYVAAARAGLVIVSLFVAAGMVVRVADRWTTTACPADVSTLVSDPAAWRTVCFWIRDNTPPEAIFLTPRMQSSFKWYAQRAEVVTTKDVPQDDANLLAWVRRRGDVQWQSLHNRNTFSLAGLTEANVRNLVKKYGLKYVVVDQVIARRDQVPIEWSFRRVYPADPNETASYEVYEVTPES